MNRKANDFSLPGADLSLKKWCEKKLHHRRGRFFNPFSPIAHKNLGRLLRWKLFSRNRFKSFYAEEPLFPVKIDWAAVKAHPGLAVTFIKHACVMIKDKDGFLLVDPVFSGLFCFADFSPLAGGFQEMPAPGHILITHGHYDHL